MRRPLAAARSKLELECQPGDQAVFLQGIAADDGREEADLKRKRWRQIINGAELDFRIVVAWV